MTKQEINNSLLDNTLEDRINRGIKYVYASYISLVGLIAVVAIGSLYLDNIKLKKENTRLNVQLNICKTIYK